MIWNILTGLALLIGGGVIVYLVGYVASHIISINEVSYAVFYDGVLYGMLKSLMSTWLPLAIVFIVILYMIVNSRKIEGPY